ncbi:ANTAR domain-containing protein [uncultured Friedmanniella sp.]|uniref:ANTAR domain-containing protein n=1 Tax=uncultured Friedmanniella sp. TaxID=335381 RepID=UPI0035CA4AA8
MFELLVRSGWRPPSGWVLELLLQFGADFGVGSDEVPGPDTLLGIVAVPAASPIEDAAVRRARRLFALQESEAAQDRAQAALADSRRLTRLSSELQTRSRAARRRAVSSDAQSATDTSAGPTPGPATAVGTQLAGLEATIAQLKEAVVSNRTVGAAVGVAMERFQLNRATALGYLIRQSQDNNHKLVDVAQQLLTAAEGDYAGRSAHAPDARRR